MNTTIEQAEAEEQDPFAELGAQAIANQLGDLARLRAVAMAMVEQLAVPADATAPVSTVEQRALAFTRVARAVRQIIVLEQEVLGFRCFHPKLYGRVHEDRFDAARHVVGERRMRADREPVERSDLRAQEDLRDSNDLREQDDLDDYADTASLGGDPDLRSLHEVIVAMQGEGSLPSGEPRDAAPNSLCASATATMLAPVRRTLGTHGPPGG